MNRFFALAIAITLSSTTLLAEWTHLGPISAPDQQAQVPTVTMDMQSNTTAAWSSIDKKAAFSSFMSAGGQFDSPIPIVEATEGEELLSPQLFTNAEGMRTGIWLTRRLKESKVVGLSFKASTNRLGSDHWSSRHRKVNILPHGLPNPQIAADKYGNVLAAWTVFASAAKGDKDPSYTQTFVFSALSELAKEWSPGVRLHTTGTTIPYATAPGLAIANGFGLAVWVSHPTGQAQRMHWARYDFWKQGWIPTVVQQTIVLAWPVPLPEHVRDIVDISVALHDPNNAITALATSDSLLYTSVLLPPDESKKEKIAQWSEVELRSSPNTTASQSKLVMDQLGNATLIWVESDIYGLNQLMVSTRPFNGSFASPIPLTSPSQLIYGTRLVSTSAGDLLATWVTEDEGIESIHTITKPLNEDWSAIETVASSANHPYIALNDAGNAVIAWEDPVTHQIEAASWEHLFPQRVPEPPSNFVGEPYNNGSVYTDRCYLDAEWDASPSSSVVKYVIFRDQIPFLTIDADVAPHYEISKRIPCEDGLTSRYTIAAVNELGFMSSRVPLEKPR